MGVHAHALKRSTRRCVGMALESRIINFRNGYILFLLLGRRARKIHAIETRNMKRTLLSHAEGNVAAQ